MPERRRLDPDIEERLTEWFGGTWRALDYGVQLPGLALCARYDRSEAGRWVLTGLVLLGDDGEVLTADRLRTVPLAALENSMNLSSDAAEAGLDEIKKLPALRRQPGMTPEDFSRLVAQHYRAWAALVPHPASAMAAEHGVKLPTVHTWIRE